MAIEALPDSTVHLLNSAQILTTPASLVKELVDNALDAKATSVDVVISPNTLDKIEVTDNGHGISLEDLNVLGKRGHTSKLRSFEELRFLGGATLGFRGEALASALQLGDVVVTTKTDGETVANMVKLQSGGGIKENSRRSHPTGTTVSVTSFMYKLPVRKKTFEKESTKTVTKIRQLLLAFALARPSVRFSFRVIKASKESWSFSPRTNDGIREVVSQVIGRDTSNQCIEKIFTFSDLRCHSTTKSSNDVDPKSRFTLTGDQIGSELFTLEAFLPKPGFDPSKIGKGHYISIDSRPVCHDKGTMKRIVTLYKSYIRGAVDNPGKIQSPFLRLNLRCPNASYDPNIEPAKDDVLFTNEVVIIEAIKQFLKGIYGVPSIALVIVTPSSSSTIANNTELLRSRIPISPPSSIAVSSPPSCNRSLERTEHNLVKRPSGNSQDIPNDLAQMKTMLDTNECSGTKRHWGVNMSSDDTSEMESYELPRPVNQAHHEQNQARIDGADSGKSQVSLNPWLIAKMMAPNSSRNVKPFSNLQLSPGPSDASSISATKSLRELQGPNPRANDHTGVIALSHIGGDVSAQVQPSIDHEIATSIHHSVEGDESLFIEEPADVEPARNCGFMTARNILQELLISPPSSTLLTKHNRKTNSTRTGTIKPFLSPLTFANDHLHQTTLSPTLRQPSANNANQGSYQNPNSGSELDWAMEFEKRKAEATRRRREEIRNERASEEQANHLLRTESSPHKNRYDAAIARLENDQHAPHLNSSTSQQEVLKTSLPDDDPRAYLMRCQNSTALQPMRMGKSPAKMRVKSTRLPLETISHNPKLHKLLQISTPSVATVRKLALVMLALDEYVIHGQHPLGLVVDSSDADGVIRQVTTTVESWVEKQGNHEEEGQNWGYDFKGFEDLRNMSFLR